MTSRKKRAGLQVAEEGEVNHEHSANGSNGEGTRKVTNPKIYRQMVEDKALVGKAKLQQADNEGGTNLDVGGLTEQEALAGESASIHLQDSGTDRKVVPA